MGISKTRQAAVAGRFYPANREEIIKQLSDILNSESKHIDISLARHQIIGAIVPHAGYMFSAYQAVHFFEILKSSKEKFDAFFIINPNHTGYGKEISLDENDYWETPLGITEIDRGFYKEMNFEYAADAHQYEHSGEVMLPLLQYFLDYPFKIVPITLSRQNLQNAKKIASSIFEANKKFKKKICIIASSDFSHFQNPRKGFDLDQLVVDRILKFDSDGVEDEVLRNRISVCGYGPIMTLMEYAKLVSDSPQNKILKRGHSGEIIPSNEVVDYISFLFYDNH
jgi:AmmeMemoRadiSam system protein B